MLPSFLTGRSLIPKAGQEQSSHDLRPVAQRQGVRRHHWTHRGDVLSSSHQLIPRKEVTLKHKSKETRQRTVE